MCSLALPPNSSRASALPDIVVANAGVSRGALTEHAEDLAVFRSVLDTNVLGLVHTFQPFLAAMRGARRGALVGIASVAGFRGLPGSGAYSASKAAAITYLESLRLELRGTGVAVVTICPGYVATPMTARNPYRMPFLLGADTGRAARRARDRAAPALLRAALADGARRAIAARLAAARLRRAVRARAAQAAAGGLTRQPGCVVAIAAEACRMRAPETQGPPIGRPLRCSGEAIGQIGIRRPTVTAQ